MGINTIDIIHYDPFLFTDALPYIGGFTATILAIDLFSVIIVEMVDFIGNHILDAPRILLRYIGHEVAAVGHRADVSIKYLYLFVGIFKEQLRSRFQCREVLVGVAII